MSQHHKWSQNNKNGTTEAVKVQDFQLVVSCVSQWAELTSSRSDVCDCNDRRWSWTPTWSESAARTTGTWFGRSRAPASRGWCGSTGELSADSSPVREARGPTGRTASHLHTPASPGERADLFILRPSCLVTDYSRRWNGNCPAQKRTRRCVANWFPTMTTTPTVRPALWGTTWVRCTCKLRLSHQLGEVKWTTLCLCDSKALKAPAALNPSPWLLLRRQK